MFTAPHGYLTSRLRPRTAVFYPLNYLGNRKQLMPLLLDKVADFLPRRHVDSDEDNDDEDGDHKDEDRD